MIQLPPFELIDLHPAPADVAAAVRAGLQRQPRQLPAWLLYDQRGSELFAEICHQPEYQLTRTEQALLNAHARAIAAPLPAGPLVLEFGAGSAEKVSPLLDALRDPAYMAIDISAAHLGQAGSRLQARHPQVPMLGLCADYSQPLVLPLPPPLQQRPRLGFFPGSSLGNFEPAEALQFLGRLNQMLGLGSLLLIGIDQPRPPALLEAAYNDRAGISAAFALNLLTRLQRELGAELDPSGFSYRARWQEQEQRIEMALVSQGQQRLRLLGLELEFAPGEALITEYSYKFSPQAFIQLAAAAGWTPRGRWCDPADQFSLHLLQAGVPTANC
jgi:dimethylhistidine N-methyltransferase